MPSASRPVPLWIQGLVTGVFVGLFVAAALMWSVDAAAGDAPHTATRVLVVATVVAFAAAVGCYIPTEFHDDASQLTRTAATRPRTGSVPQRAAAAQPQTARPLLYVVGDDTRASR